MWRGLLPRLLRIPPGQAIVWAVSDQITGCVLGLVVVCEHATVLGQCSAALLLGLSHALLAVLPVCLPVLDCQIPAKVAHAIELNLSPTPKKVPADFCSRPCSIMLLGIPEFTSCFVSCMPEMHKAAQTRRVLPCLCSAYA